MSTPNPPYGAGETQPWPGYERAGERYQAPVAAPQLPTVIKTKPSIMRIAFGVFLGLVMFSVVWVVVSILLLGVFASTVRDALDEIESTTNSQVDDTVDDLVNGTAP